MTEFEEFVTISAPPEVVWATLADIGSIYVWNPGVVHSEQTTTGAVNVGARRRCDLGGKNYLNEEVIEFVKPHKLTIRITDTNLPFKTADIRFRLEGQGNETTVTVSPIYDLKFGWLGRLLDSLMVRRQYRKGMRGLLTGLKNHIESHDAS